MLVALACLALPAVSGAAGPRLKVVGNQIVDARSGQVFVPRGVNWPSFEYACKDGYGYSNSANRRTVGPDAAGAALIASWHINTVRLPLNQDCWLGDDGLPKFGKASGYRAAVSGGCRCCTAPASPWCWTCTGRAGRHRRQRPARDGRRPLGRLLALGGAAFKSDRSVIFDVFNEPYSRYGDTGPWSSTDLGLLAQRRLRGAAPAHPQAARRQDVHDDRDAAMVDAIRSTGAKQPIILGGRDYAQRPGRVARQPPARRSADRGLPQLRPPALPHPQCWDGVIAPMAAQVPVVSGEFGENDCSTSHVTTFMDWADLHGIGYLMWAWWVLPDTHCSTFAMLADVKGPRARRTAPPSGRTCARSPRA